MSIRDLLNSMANPFEPREDWMGRATWWWGPGKPPNVFGSGRQYIPMDQAMQASGRAMISPDASIGMPLPKLFQPDQHPFSTTTVGAGILSPVKWRGQGIFADNYALPDYVAREPNEGWWLSEGRDSNTGERVWMTNLSGLSGIVETFHPGTFGGAVRLGIAALVAWYGYKWLTGSSKRGRTTNKRRGRRRNGEGTWEVHEGSPSWHQSRAGHISAAVTTGFASREEAEAFAAKLREHHPGMPVFVRASRQSVSGAVKKHPKRRRNARGGRGR